MLIYMLTIIISFIIMRQAVKFDVKVSHLRNVEYDNKISVGLFIYIILILLIPIINLIVAISFLWGIISEYNKLHKEQLRVPINKIFFVKDNSLEKEKIQRIDKYV
jgi:uncharacterized membrane protein YjgN (DUF898 family)